MELTPLRQFRAIAREGHMTRAAERLGVSQPALSAVVKKLEAEVGAELLHRTGRGVALTEAGALFLEHAERALASVDAGLRGVRELLGLERGLIRVGGGATATSYLLPGVVRSFRAAHPGVTFTVREAGSARTAEAVASGELDVGVVTLPLAASVSGEVLASGLVRDELRLIAPEAHRLRGRKTVRLAELAGEAVVAFEAGSAVRGVIDRAASSAGVRLDVAMELRSIESIKRMVAAGVGVAFVSRFALGRGEGVRCRDASLTRELAVVRSSGRALGPAASAFESMLLSRWRVGGRGRHHDD